MKQKGVLYAYTLVWFSAVLILFYSLWLINGDVRTVNYSGIVRGTTQQVINEEIYGVQDDELIEYVDSIIYDLQTGEGVHNLVLNNDPEFQAQLDGVQERWCELKELIYEYREGVDTTEAIFELGQEHFERADAMTSWLEMDSHAETSRLIIFFCICMILFVAIFIMINEYFHKIVEKSLNRNTLTGLLNKRGFELEIKKILHNNSNKVFAVVKLDINNFKLINDTYDYAYGDYILCKIGKALEQCAKKGCICGHYEADNFMLLSEYRSDELEKMYLHLAEEFKGIDVSRLFNEIEFTVAAYKILDNMADVQTIISKVTLAHKVAKTESGVFVSWYTDELQLRIERENNYVQQLEQALENHEFKVYLQPQVNLHTMKIVAAESLVRWQLPNQSLRFPDEFISIFEKKGLISKVDFYMLEEVCEILVKRKEAGKELFRIAVNFSRVTLSKTNFYEEFIRIVDKYNISYEYIEIEVTESALNDLSKTVIQVLVDLKEVGFKLAMDDYGTGYSSMSSLGHLPIQILKLDRQFLYGIDTNEKMKMIVTSTVELAHAMGLRVICEGVEQDSHVKYLQSIGCDYAQGYYFARPMPAVEFELN